MAQLIPFTASRVTRIACLTLACSLAQGCGNAGSPTEINDGAFIQVMYEGQPLGDIQIRLHQVRGGPVIAQSVSGQDGKAYYQQIPSPEPSSYYVTVEALSDGSWDLTTEAYQSISENISLKPIQVSPGQQLEIPDGAIITNSSPKRR